jgi:hypothetical protein
LLTPLRFNPHTMRFLCPVGLFVLSLFLSACGGSYGGSNPIPPTTGPDAILNGATLATATSHWVSAPCNVQVELTSDYGFWSIVIDNSGTKSSGSFTWAVGPDPNSVTVGPGSGLGGFFWVSALKNITGSTSSQMFTANVTVETQSTPQSLGSCTFTLMQGNLP